MNTIIKLIAIIFAFSFASCAVKLTSETPCEKKSNINQENYDKYDNICLLSGKIYDNVKIKCVNSDHVFIEDEKGKTNTLEYAEIFSFKNKLAEELVIYKPDSTMAYDMTVEQMRMFIKGEIDAKAAPSSRANFLGSIVFGGASGLVGFWGIPVPVIYGLGTNSFSPSLKKANQDLINNQYYVDGYKGKVKSKRLKNAFIGGFTSFGIAALIVILL
ncbi:MAG: hypothetical protein WCK02_07245 [Bacteroidota bacterium]